ncbi:flagellar hook protein FlgE [Caloranaerobacter azorensis DSM 13643]|uniref:Flagellar hook protein FlgE n=1 Tax=Caloranaerobacter azorensis DSM 13643 TaxID=1121264 RepID=A0A1M5RLU3_9FIRM|nr:flagellar hook protein FlgE [Caloranaerobacter azorensis]SHH27294.1 flagellar hook protein FlgE [Caloranaerobacter azorensis DSM 13643]
MMRSMYSGVSGLRLHQLKMDVIGNNIANVNTVGYKRGQVNFQEVFSQVVRGAGAPQEGRGGTNPQQIGLGLKLGSINTVFTKGPTQRTDNPTDLMIDGEGFFMITDDPKYENIYYTRAGNFVLDREGYLVTPDGFKVLGINDKGEYAPIMINRSEVAPPSASTTIEFIGNLDSRFKDSEEFLTDTVVKDSLGNSYKVNFKFTKTANPNEWNLEVVNVINLATGEAINPAPTSSPQTLTFDNGGFLTNATKTFEIQFSGTDTYYFGSDSKNSKLVVDFSKITQFANENDVKGFDVPDQNGQLGKSAGFLTGFAVDASGVITGSFTNGEKKPLGQLVLAKFDNPMGLQKVGNNFFESTPNSGEPQIGKPSSSGFGTINPGALEMSNVDLSMEFTEMITTQRGFQANSRVITTTDEMLQELVNMKR